MLLAVSAVSLFLVAVCAAGWYLAARKPDRVAIADLSVEDRQRLVMDIRAENGDPVERVTMSLTPFRRIVKDYFQICESYFDAIKRLTPSQIETIDMARRGLHNEGSEMLSERLRDKVDMDSDTARRLFTLICVLHIRG